MKKGLLAVILLLAVVVFVSPGIVGRIAEKSVNENMTMGTAVRDDIVVTTESFDRGWFSSEGQHRIEFTDVGFGEYLSQFAAKDSAGELPTLLVHTKIDHGIIPLSSMAREKGSLSPGLGKAVSTVSVEFPDGDVVQLPGSIYSDISLTGVTTSNYLLAAGTHDVEGSSMSWGNTDIELVTDPSANRISLTGIVTSLAVANDLQTTGVGQIDFSATQTPSKFGYAIGDVSVVIDSIVITDPVTDTTAFGPFSFSASSEVDGDRINATTNMHMVGLSVPQFGEMGIAIDGRMDGLDGHAAGDIAAKLRSMPPDAPPEMLMPVVQDDLLRMAAAGFTLDFDKFDVELPQGAVNTRLRIAMPESDADDFNWTTALLAMDAMADISVPVELMDLAMAMNPQTGALVGMGYMRREGDVYRMEAAYKQGLLTVNGVPTPIPLPAAAQ